MLIDRLCMCMNVWPCTGGGLILNVELIDRLCMCMTVWPCTGGGGGGED